MAVPLAGLELTCVPGIAPTGNKLWDPHVHTVPAANLIVAVSREITARMDGCSSLSRCLGGSIWTVIAVETSVTASYRASRQTTE
jgi:hypothetical protein